MTRILFLAWRYVLYHKVKTVILTACLTLTIMLPLAAHALIAHYGDSLMRRAKATPLVAGVRGNRFGLVLKSLYFGSSRVDSIPMTELDAINDTALATAIPILAMHTARGWPIVGVSPEYYDFRELRIREGTEPLRLGQAVLGSTVAAKLGLGVGDTLFSDQQDVYNLATTYPLKMHICGVLEKSGSPDDEAVLIDVKTAWIIEGIAHGHQNVAKDADEEDILSRTEKQVTASPALFKYNEVMPDNIRSFHVHATRDELPLSAIIVVPSDTKSGTMLKARYNQSSKHQMLRPAEVVEELMGLVFKIKRFFDLSFTLIVITTVLFLILVVLLSNRLRRREMETMSRIGCSRATAFWLQAAELGIVVMMSTVLAGGLTAGITLAAPRLVSLL